MRSLFSLIIIFTSCMVNAANPAVQLTNILKSMTSLRADFSQSMLDNNQHVLQSANGRMTILKPGRFKWEILSPDEILIIVDHHKIINFDKTLEQVLIQKSSKQAYSLPITQLLIGNKDISKDFIIKDGKACIDSNSCFALYPKNEDAGFSEALLGFSNNKLNFFKLSDNLGQDTIFIFKNIKLNGAVSADEFKFKIPANVDVISES
jgi:outer membrane lipoprotein carrier protein